MKILIYGAGTVGCTYGWLLSKVGHEVTIMVRDSKKKFFKNNGVSIRCTDFRNDKKHIDDIVFHPQVIDQLSPDNDFEYIIVAISKLNLEEVLPILATSAGNANILFFMNLWVDDFEKINKFLSQNQYFFGFPFMVGGGRSNTGIESVISGIKQSCTPIGEITGEITPRVQKICAALEQAGLKPIISTSIKDWLGTHYAIAAGLSGGIMKAKSGKDFSQNTIVLKQTIKAIREGLKICSYVGFSVKAEKSNLLYQLPLFICLPIARKVYGNEALIQMFDGHLTNAPEEIKQMLTDVIDYGKRNRLSTQYLEKLYS